MFSDLTEGKTQTCDQRASHRFWYAASRNLIVLCKGLIQGADHESLIIERKFPLLNVGDFLVCSKAAEKEAKLSCSNICYGIHPVLLLINVQRATSFL